MVIDTFLYVLVFILMSRLIKNDELNYMIFEELNC